MIGYEEIEVVPSPIATEVTLRDFSGTYGENKREGHEKVEVVPPHFSLGLKFGYQTGKFFPQAIKWGGYQFSCRFSENVLVI